MIAQLDSDLSLEENPADHQFMNSSFDQDQDSFFEFFSEGYTASTYPFGDKDIIFCGKLIPYNKEAPHVAAAEKKTQKNTETSNKSSTKKWRFFIWRRFRRSKSKVVLNCSKQSQVKGDNSTTNNFSFPTAKSYKRCDLSLGKVSKSKWYLFMTGMVRFPTEMELRDIKSRPNRRSPSTMFGDNCKARCSSQHPKAAAKAASFS
ncbi:hypothetical protein M0R45_037103 [Rubus argutus]|uniref:Uncharacterized protein n=1 Tax=Rubus argutus TaxID=59490 RepID=A0AAW1W1X5_RUBAR